jgi:cell division protein FtsI (penicillin-binding protein 3)
LERGIGVAEQPFNWRPTIAKRVAVAAAVFAVWTLGIEVRLIYLQVVSHADLVARAERQQMRTVPSPAKRGEISDRHGRVLAYSVDADTIYAVPHEIEDKARTATALCDALADCHAKDRATLLERLSGDRAFIYVKRRVTPLEARHVAALNLEGVGFMKENRRFYPNRELAAHVLGYVGTDNVGLGGLEAAYDKVVRGREGTLIVQNDARRRVFGRLERTPTTGGSLELTIDERLQYIVERELAAGVEEKRADGGAAVVIDPQTGEVLAMASYPTFNPNEFNEATDSERRNRAVQDIYEPGSTFKVVTVAAALEEKLMPPDALIDTSPGIIRLPGNRIVDEFEGHNYGVLSLTQVIVKSSNVGAIKIGLRLGPERLGMYVNRFGFGRPTSPDFPGESPGIVWNPAKLNDGAVASISMGYQVGVTPLQMTAAMNTVANGGNWIEPRIVRAAIRDGVRTPITPKVTRRAISPDTVAQLIPILEAVVVDGTGKKAQVAGYTVAGKTGTADKIINGRYSGSQQNVSFLGFVPSRNPAITVIVMVDTPRVGSDTGGFVAAPIFQRIAEASLRYLGVPQNVDAPPPIVVAQRDESPVTPTHTSHNNPEGPSIIQVAGGGEAPVLPDLTGQSARDALRTLAKLGMTARLKGRGVVSAQSPAPGTPVERGATCTLVLDRDPLRQVQTAGAIQ